MPDIIPENEFIASFSNKWSVSRTKDLVFIDFYFCEIKAPNEPENCQLIKRIAIAISDARQFNDIFRMIVFKEDNPPPASTRL